MNDNGQGVAVDPQALIDALAARVQQLTMENVMLQAVLAKLRQEPAPMEEPSS